jgi:hypothetical protein
LQLLAAIPKDTEKQTFRDGRKGRKEKEEVHAQEK